jgi:signal transduction histidine kinase
MVSAQCRMICKNGAVRWYEGTGQNLLADPAVKAIVVNFYDITERKLVEDILKMDRLSLQQLVEERSQALAESQKELKQASRLADIGTLAATVAHELRNPLGVIQIAAHNLKRKNKQLSQDQHLNNIEKKVWEGNQIIDNLLSYSRIKMPSFQAVNVIEIMEECLHHAQGRFASQAVQIIRVYNAQEACIIEADPNQLREIFVNVLNNAFQSMIGLFHGHIEVRIEAGDTVMFTIQDSGIGIDSDDLMKVFNPFFTRKAKGTGLGLTICNEIVNLHHGRIEITSQKNSGTSVCITLPVTHAHSLLK